MRCLLLVGLLCLGLCAPACGSGGGSATQLPPGTVLDQFTLEGAGSSLESFGQVSIGQRVVDLGQTFTVGVTGRLVAIDYIAGGAESDLIVRILPAPGGVIDPDDANALFETRIREVDVQPPGFRSFLRLPGNGIPVTAGEVLAITFRHAEGLGKCLDAGFSYDRGRSFERDNQGTPDWTPRLGQGDLYFGTYVAP